jgi:hydrogenase maturation protease
MRNVLVIGYGNPLRGDDGVGWKAAEALAAESAGPVAVMPCHQLTPELADPISRSDLVIFVDACCDNIPGKLSSHLVRPDTSSCDGFSHRVDPAALLASAARLYGRCPEAILISVSGEFFGYAEELSPAVQAVFPELLQCVRQACSQETPTMSPAESRSHPYQRGIVDEETEDGR